MGGCPNLRGRYRPDDAGLVWSDAKDIDDFERFDVESPLRQRSIRHGVAGANQAYRRW